MLSSVLVWFRRDLRNTDHTALAEAMRRAQQVFCVFVFDWDILEALPTRTDRRVEYIQRSLVELDAALRQQGGALIVIEGSATHEIPRLALELGVSAVFANRDYEPQAKLRDAIVAEALIQGGIGFELFKDQVIFDGVEILTQTGRPFSVFTPYKNAWLKRLGDDDLDEHASDQGKLTKPNRECHLPSLEDIGFHNTNLTQIGIAPGMSGARQRINDFTEHIPLYQAQRDFPAINGCSSLSMHLRFGTISIRTLVRLALKQGALRGNEGAACWLSELIWREFYFMVLDHFPHVVEHAFKPEFDAIIWHNGEQADHFFEAWRTGQTGFPLIDAAMRQLNSTGMMHNRLRMVVASFLTKDLGIDWRRGEAYFAQQLNDFDLSANNGGWQWAASTGCDSQPYFRIFNPLRQSERFDPNGDFIRRYLPELAKVPNKHIHAPWLMNAAEQSACGVRIGQNTPKPLVDHSAARQQTLARYASAKSGT